MKLSCVIRVNGKGVDGTGEGCLRHRRSADARSFLRRLPALLALMQATVSVSVGDPLEETERQTFHLSVIGAFDERPWTVNSVADYKSRMLALAGGVMPSNVKVGVNSGLDFLSATCGGYYDYIYAPGSRLEFPTHILGQVEYHADLISMHDVCYGVGVNGMPWGDSADQSEDILHNHLEKYAGGDLLQVDRFGRIRDASLPQDPALDEQFSGSAALEMQLTLSRNASLVREYAARNCRMAMRLLGYYRDLHPDLVRFASMSSEVGQGLHANVEYCDYGRWSRAEFRDWLSGAQIYAGQGQYPSLAAFNTTFAGATGFPWASWSAVEPPTNSLWDTSPNGRWWQKWQEFRVAQVHNIVQDQTRWCIDAGWSPDQLFGHQLPVLPTSTHHLDRKQASPYTTTFIEDAGNGITTYGVDTTNTPIFDLLRANDKHWGIFEFNPTDTNSVANNLHALDTVWAAGARIISPYLWWGFGDWEIRDRPLETAMAQFVSNHKNDSFSQLAPHEVSPVLNDLIWTMSESNDLESVTDLNNVTFSNGVVSMRISGAQPRLRLEFNESPARFIPSDAYFAASCRLKLGKNVSGLAELVWLDEFDASGSLKFYVEPGWNSSRLNLGEDTAWRERRIKSLELRLPGAVGSDVVLDWFRLEANRCWHFNDPDEAYGFNELTNVAVAGGMLSATSGPDGYFYFSTDKRDPNVDADRAWIDAAVFKKVRVRMTASAPGTAQLFWWKRGTSFYQTGFGVQAGTHTYEIDLSTHPDWNGPVTRFRLDPVNTAGVSVAVDFLSVSPVLLTPQVANADLIVNSPTPVFLWDAATEPNHGTVTHALELATDFFFTNIVYSKSGLTSGRLVYGGATALDGLYWWRVQARDAFGAISAWSVPMPMFVRPWTFDRLADGAYSNNFSSASASSGIWQATTTGSDPYVYFNTAGFNSRNQASVNQLTRGLNADLYNRLRLRAKVGNTFLNFAQLFFFPTAGGFVSIDLNLPGDNQWHEIDLDLSGNASWKGYVQDVRIDPTTANGRVVSLDYAYVLPPDPGQPRMHLHQTDGAFLLTWEDADLVLENAPGINGPWTRLPNASSPFVVLPSQPMSLFRLAR